MAIVPAKLATNTAPNTLTAPSCYTSSRTENDGDDQSSLQNFAKYDTQGI